MASNYGPHFGVRRWDEDVAIREGRYKTPATGNPLLLGTAVAIDFANPGFMKQAGAEVPCRSGVNGLLIYEDQFLANGPIGSINQTVRRDTSQNAFAQLGRYAVIAGGAGSKFWFKNLAARVLPDGTNFPALVPVTGLGVDNGDTVELGDYLSWSGTAWHVAAGNDYATAGDTLPAAAWFQVVTLNSAANSCEVTLVR